MTETAQTIALPTLEPDVAKAQNALGKNFAPFALSKGNAKLLAGIAGSASPAKHDPWLKLTLDGAEAAVQMPSSLMEHLTKLPVDNGFGNDVALLLEDAIADWLDAAEAAGLPTIRFVNVLPARPGYPVLRMLTLRGQSESGQFIQHNLPVCLSLGAAQRAARQLSNRIEPRNLPQSLPIQAHILVQGPRVTPTQLAGLRPGDGLRLPVSLGPNTPTPFTLKVGENVAQLTPGPSGFQLATALQPQPQGGSDMDQPADTSAPDTTAEEAPEKAETAPETEESSTAPDTETLPIQLSFKAADTSIRLGELGTLGAGALIPIEGGPDTALDILANGRKIGSGELVAIGDTRAVRVLTLE